MQETNPDFITISDSKYFKITEISIRQINKFYPNSTIYLYDWGLNSNDLDKLSSLKNVTRIDWVRKYHPIKINLGFFENLKIFLGITRLKGLAHNILKEPQKIGNFSNFSQMIQAEMLFLNKIECIKDFSYKTNHKFVYLDADAFLINSIDELLQQNFDLGVTMRRKNEIDFKHNHCQVLNTGVIFFNGQTKINRMILDKWLEKAGNDQEVLSEQTALVRILEKQNKNIFDNYNQTHLIKLENQDFKVRILSCEEYNYNWIEEFDPKKDIDTVKILHFKSNRFNTPIFERIYNEILK